MRERIESAPWARDLTDQQVARVLRETQVVHHSPGSIVCREGEPARHWLGILEGMVKVDTVSAEGRSTTFIGVSSGGWLGEGSLLKDELRPYEVVALRDSWIALVPQHTFRWLFETSLTFNQFLVRQLNARLGHFVSVVESCRIQSITSQVAVCIAGLFDPEFRWPKADVVQISHEEVARLCGLSRQIAGRALHDLEQAGLLRMQYGAIHVLDVDGLKNHGQWGSMSGLRSRSTASVDQGLLKP